MNLDLDIEHNHQLFLERAVESGQVWTLASPEGLAMSYSSDGYETPIIPFWSDKAYAQITAQGIWLYYEPEAIDLAQFMSDWLFGMTEQNQLAGTNWDEEHYGKEMRPLDLAAQLIDRLKTKGKDITLPDGTSFEEYATIVGQITSQAVEY